MLELEYKPTTRKEKLLAAILENDVPLSQFLAGKNIELVHSVLAYKSTQPAFLGPRTLFTTYELIRRIPPDLSMFYTLFDDYHAPLFPMQKWYEENSAACKQLKRDAKAFKAQLEGPATPDEERAQIIQKIIDIGEQLERKPPYLHQTHSAFAGFIEAALKSHIIVRQEELDELRAQLAQAQKQVEGQQVDEALLTAYAEDRQRPTKALVQGKARQMKDDPFLDAVLDTRILPALIRTKEEELKARQEKLPLIRKIIAFFTKREQAALEAEAEARAEAEKAAAQQAEAAAEAAPAPAPA